MSDMNPYSILDIPEDSSLIDIKRAYKKKVLCYHPDKNGSSEATNKFLLIRKSYELLIDTNFKKFSNIISIDDIDEFKSMIFNFLKDMNIVNKIFIQKHENKYYVIIPQDLMPQNIEINSTVNNSINTDTKFVIIIV